MGFLQQFLCYQKIYIQCHNNPDADTLASAYGAYCFFTDRGIESEMVYGGARKVKKYNIKYMIKHCGIPIRYAEELPGDAELLLVIDGQYGQGNVQKFEAPVIAVIDHHPMVMEENERVLIKSSHQSCSTIMWEFLVKRPHGHDGVPPWASNTEQFSSPDTYWPAAVQLSARPGSKRQAPYAPLHYQHFLMLPASSGDFMDESPVLKRAAPTLPIAMSAAEIAKPPAAFSGSSSGSSSYAPFLRCLPSASGNIMYE